ncbi:MAG: hypothetical protein K0R90_1504 [Oscillospiraceae bacterium]|nr:hypothetical protein [Oscillospiraceae bacterium]
MKKFLKIYYVLPAIVLLFIIILFAGWHVIPKKPLDIVLLNKTVPANQTDRYNNIASDYRKHIGFFWILNQQRYVKKDSKEAYDYRTDYYGPILDEKRNIVNRDLKSLAKTPDMVYLADAYGDEANKQGDSGISYENIAVASTAHANGSTLIGEFNIASGETEDSVKTEMQKLFGMKSTGWVGRYVADMKDLTDIPKWVLTLYERQYGKAWNYSGSGIILSSQKDELIVLQSGVDFEGNSMTIEITKDYQKQFGKLKQNYYSWFEVTSADYGTDVIAEYKLSLNEKGKQKFQKILSTLTFPAITRKVASKAPAYYFSGDFNDYVAKERYPKFLFSSSLYRLFSYDRKGDITNFFWNFYMPLMQKILYKTYDSRNSVLQPKINTQAVSKISSKKIEYQVDGNWKTFKLKGFNINGLLPGDQPYKYTRDINVYKEFLDSVAEIGGNCVRVYDLMPPEFYRALYEYNLSHADKAIYFMQNVVTPTNVNAETILGEASRTELKKNIEYIVDAVHGKAEVPAVGKRQAGTYVNDVSKYLLSYTVEIDTSMNVITSINKNYPSYQFSGEYLSCSSNASEALMAFVCDSVYGVQQKKYGYIAPVGAHGNAELLPSMDWSLNNEQSEFDVSRIQTTPKSKDAFFISYKLSPSDAVFLNNTESFKSYKDEAGTFAYGGYINTVKSQQKTYPLLIDGFGLSTNMNAFEKENSVNGLTEQQQGEGLVRMLKSINSQNFLGGLISDLNDSWTNCAEDMKPFVVPLRDNALWQNTLDPTQNEGVLAVNPKKSNDIELSLKDNDKLKEMQISHDEAFVYMTIVLDKVVDYDREQLIIGLDTYQRNNGEYLYDAKYFATGLSGMEYVVKFESKNSASIYVAKSYNRNRGQFSSKESYKASFDYIATLKYGTYDESNNNFYQVGSTINLRIPWSLINFVNPSKKMVINDTRSKAQIEKEDSIVQTTNTDGILFSLLIADKETKDTSYIFPLDKQSTGYKKFTWQNWEKPSCVIRKKQSFNILFKYFKVF